MTTVLLAVGDASGDRYAADLVRELRELRADVRCVGLGGAELEKAGCRLVVHQRDLAVGGFVELLPHAGRIARAWRRMGALLRRSAPDLVVLVDSSGFNLPFARRARRAGVPVLYYVAPQVWAWRRGRIAKLAARVDRIAVIFPFEPAVYAGRGVSVEFVGHPLVEHLDRARRGLTREGVRAGLGIEADARVVALFPGSRRNELRHCLPVHLETARVLHARDPRIHFVLAVAPSLERDAVEARVRAAALPGLLRLELLEGRSLEAWLACDAALVKPGTATVEAAILGRPLVVAARGNPLSAALLRRLVRVEWLAMPNLIAGEGLVPEYLQDAARPPEVAEALLALLAGPAREAQLRGLAVVRERLGEGGAARRAAAIADEMLRASGRP